MQIKMQLIMINYGKAEFNRIKNINCLWAQPKWTKNNNFWTFNLNIFEFLPQLKKTMLGELWTLVTRGCVTSNN